MYRNDGSLELVPKDGSWKYFYGDDGTVTRAEKAWHMCQSVPPVRQSMTKYRAVRRAVLTGGVVVLLACTLLMLWRALG